MSEIVERVSKAIRETNANAACLSSDELTEALARAAIEALRHPTKEMALVGVNYLPAYLENDDRDLEYAVTVYEEMIKAALRVKP